ncbi:hypothetical protein Q5741_18815 [Paenibacillus sp. JX-17]|uniref:DUF6906 domain-containing protein n=1 Tax=Paenibacillus lacisoli TaxID=3064525 RepID=A0ABT9CLC2_9BACL|nr:hypothetical protein [Paenibacillus sp. JX-17]MDO7908456.1 hypothetical protein [Paenibacillus sp. JX-17]
MKQPKRPTRRQKIEIAEARLVPDNWLVHQDTAAELTIVHRESGKIRTLRRGA